MAWFKKAFFLSLTLILLLAGLWLVIANDQQVSLSLFLLNTPVASLGFLVLLSFVCGGLVGMLLGLNLFSVFRLNAKVFGLKRELRQLQDELAERHKRF